MATLTTVEAAELVGVSVRTVQWWVERGYLAPCNRHPTRTMTWDCLLYTSDAADE